VKIASDVYFYYLTKFKCTISWKSTIWIWAHFHEQNAAAPPEFLTTYAIRCSSESFTATLLWLCAWTADLHLQFSQQDSHCAYPSVTVVQGRYIKSQGCRVINRPPVADKCEESGETRNWADGLFQLFENFHEKSGAYGKKYGEVVATIK